MKTPYAELERENAALLIDRRNLESVVELLQGIRVARRIACAHCCHEVVKGECIETSRKAMIEHAQKCESNPLVARVKQLELCLKEILDYPIHSEPTGAAMAMQDIAKQHLLLP